MKQSNYNFLISDENKIICFNALSLFYFKIKKEQKQNVIKTLNSPDLYKNRCPSFIKTLREGKFIIDDGIDEYKIIKDNYDRTINEKKYQLIILPTLECNFRCWYCIQNHVKGHMSVSIIDNVCKHIEYMIEKEKIISLVLNWFGGEPFKYYIDVIKPISIYAKRLCEKNNIPFCSCTTTNGFLLNEQIIKELKFFNFTSFQITLDGDREHHNKTRISKQTSSFDTILKNINTICTLIPNVRVTIRINYNERNLNTEQIVNEVTEIIPLQNRKSIVFIFRRIWQVGDILQARDKIVNINSKIIEKGFSINKEADITTNYIPCYTNRKYCNTITFNGGIYKCTNRNNLYSSELGQIAEDGSIKWKIDNFVEQYSKQYLFDNKSCKECKYLPLCMGPCPKSFEDSNFNTPKFKCLCRSNDTKFEDAILSFCNNN
jgi:uncharacterized protein